MYTGAFIAYPQSLPQALAEGWEQTGIFRADSAYQEQMKHLREGGRAFTAHFSLSGQLNPKKKLAVWVRPVYYVQCGVGLHDPTPAPEGSSIEQRCISRYQKGILDALPLGPDECEECIEERLNREEENAKMFEGWDS